MSNGAQRLATSKDNQPDTREFFVDLAGTTLIGALLRMFDNVEEIPTSTVNSGKLFPRTGAYAGSLLQFLLRAMVRSFER